MLFGVVALVATAQAPQAFTSVMVSQGGACGAGLSMVSPVTASVYPDEAFILSNNATGALLGIGTANAQRSIWTGMCLAGSTASCSCRSITAGVPTVSMSVCTFATPTGPQACTATYRYVPNN